MHDADLTPRTAHTRRVFLDAALRLFAAKGYQAATMGEIARVAGASRASLYQYFSSKPQIVLGAMEMYHDDVIQLYLAVDQLPEHSATAVRAWLEQAYDLWRTNKGEYFAMGQAIFEDDDVRVAWLEVMDEVTAKMQHCYAGCATLEERKLRKADVVTLIMQMERAFQFLLAGMSESQEEYILTSLAAQWTRIFKAA